MGPKRKKEKENSRKCLEYAKMQAKKKVKRKNL